MSLLHGQLKSGTGAGFSGHHVEVTFDEDVRVDPDAAIWAPAVRRSDVAKDGTFTVNLPEPAAARGPWFVVVLAPDGAVLARQTYEALPAHLSLQVEPLAPLVVEASADPLLGRRAKGTGRLLDDAGKRVAANIQVALWAARLAPDDETPAEPAVVAVSRTDANGYFSFVYPPGRFAAAHGVVGVGGGLLVPIPLADATFPRSVVLVVTLPEDDTATDKDCGCAPSPPRAPDPIDVVSSPESFSSDVGGRCVDFTVPNRAIEEFSFYSVVRTTEPAIQGLTITNGRKALQRDILGSITRIFESRTRLPDGREKPSQDAKPSHDESAKAILEGGVSLDALARISSANGFTVAELKAAADQTAIDNVNQLLELARRPEAARAPLTAANPVDWDAEPTFYQAATIAHGHLLHFKQVWRADGYSLGDLLYSLPLAPCQKKQIAVLDWERREIGERTEFRDVNEDLQSMLSRDRDISEIVQSALTEKLRGASAAATFGMSKILASGLGALGIGVAGSAATQTSARSLSANSLQQIRDRTLQASSSVRSQRSTVVQSVTQGETVRAETEVITNHNHCHAITVQYFEVLRHFLVTQELADVQECLFIPLFLSAFNEAKALRWRTVLERALQDTALRPGFDALERKSHDWVDSDLPIGRFSDENVVDVSGEFRVSFVIPRPPDNDDGSYKESAWIPYGTFVPAAHTIFTELLSLLSARDRDRVFQERIAPRMARKFLDRLTFHFIGAAPGDEQPVKLEPTMVSTYATDAPLLVTMRPLGPLPGWPRDRIRAFEIRAAVDLPPGSKVIVHSGAAQYRTAHFSHTLFDDRRILNDLLAGDPVRITTWPDREEQRNPRAEDRELARRLLAHLNEHLEYYHKLIWWTMDPDRRYMLLDGFIAPNSGGRSVASVIDNRLIGIVGNCLVMPVAPGIQIDPTYRQDLDHPVDLIHHYAPTTPTAPMRISVPTRGVFAESVMGACNSCEEKDDSRFWRFEESPCGDEPTPIQPVSTDSRRVDPGSLQAQDLPTPVVNIQNAPAPPDPTGLASALQVLSNPNLFRDVTGLQQNQLNAAAAMATTQDTLRQMISSASQLAKKKNAQQNLPSAMQTLYQAMKKGVVTDKQGNELAQGLFKAAGASDEQPRDADHPINKILDNKGNLKSVVYQSAEEYAAASYQDQPGITSETLLDDTGGDGGGGGGGGGAADQPYGGYDLALGDRDTNQRYAGRTRKAADGDVVPAADAKGFVRELQDDLAELGFTIGTPDGTLGRNTDWAIREFQIHAKMEQVAQEAEAAGAPTRYVERLSSVSNTRPYGGPVSGVANAATRALIKSWIADRWRCPVVIEAWALVDGRATGLATGYKNRAGNLWLYDDHPDTAPRMSSTDFSTTYNAPGSDLGIAQHLGTYATYGGWAGPAAYPPDLTWRSAEITPETLVGKPAASLTASERSTFKVIRAVSEVETYGFFDAINSYDDVFASFGVCHWAVGKADAPYGGELPPFLAFLAEADPDAFDAAVGRFGVKASKPWSDATGNLVLFDKKHAVYHTTLALQKDDGSFASMGTLHKLKKDDLNWFRSWHWFFRFAMAGRTIEGFQRAMWPYGRLRLRDIRRIPWGHGMAAVKDPATGMYHAATIGDVYTSERAMALIMRWHVRYPGHVVSDGGPGAHLIAARNGSGLPTGAGWAEGLTNDDEAKLIQGLLNEARTVGGDFIDSMQQVHDWPNYVGRDGLRYHLDLNTIDAAPHMLSADRGSLLLEDADLPGYVPVQEWVQ